MAETTALTTTDPARADVRLSKKELAGSKLYPHIRTPEQAAVMLAKARELGIGVTAVIEGHYIVGGKPAMTAHLIASLVRRSEKYTYRVREKTDKQCRIEFFERGTDGELESLGVETFTMAMATRAGLASGTNWKKYPEAMLFARCLTAGVRTHCPDALGGSPVYTVEELSPTTEVDEDGCPLKPTEAEVIDAEVVDSPPADLLEEVKQLITDAGVKPEVALQYMGVDRLEDADADALNKMKQYATLKIRNTTK